MSFRVPPLVALALVACTHDPPANAPASAPPIEVPAPAPTPSAAVPTDYPPLEVKATYGGRIHRGQAHQAIRSQAAYDAFVEHLPKHVVRKGPHAPSEDPLVEQPAIDFTRDMILVATCPSFYCGVDIVEARREGANVVVTVVQRGEPAGAAMAQRPIRMGGDDSVGNYTAIVVRRHDGDVRFVKGAAK